MWFCGFVQGYGVAGDLVLFGDIWCYLVLFGVIEWGSSAPRGHAPPHMVVMGCGGVVPHVVTPCHTLS